MSRKSWPAKAARRSHGGLSGGAWLALAVLVAAAGVVGWGLWQRQAGSTEIQVPTAPLPKVPPAAPAPKSEFAFVRFPTDQNILQDPGTPGVFQPTAAGSPVSALYGSVRSAQVGGRLMPSFHEGMDIAPLKRDSRAQPLDTVYAAAAGRVAYANREPGNSNYGNYVVLLHQDPLGEVYTLYAHLAEVAPTVRPGMPVTLGMVLGRMGHTPASIIPLVRAHTHFEVGVIANAQFDRWFRAQRLKPDHGNYNGWNLLAVEPRGFFRMQQATKDFKFQDYLKTVPVAFEVLVPLAHGLDYFRRYPGLWQGAPCEGGWAVLACSENGAPVNGRSATPDEVRTAGGRRATVLKVNGGVLGRNGARLVVQDRGAWRIGQSGERWLEILTYP